MTNKNECVFVSRMRAVFLSVLVSCACAFCGAAITSEPAYADTTQQTATLSVSGTNNQTEARQILAMVNEARAATTNAQTNAPKEPTAALTWDYELEKAALQRAAEIAVYYDHTRPNGEDCFSVFPKSYNYYGENIQVSSGLMTVSQANKGWINSSGHYANMIDAGYTCMAAASFRVNGATYWVELFARPNTGTAETAAVNGTKTYSVEAIPSMLDLSFASKLSAVSAKGSSVQYEVVNTNKGFSYNKTPVSSASFNWSSSNAAAATVDANGKATVVGAGNVTITATNKTLSSVKITNTLTLKAPSNPSSAASVKEGWVKSGSRWWYRYADGSYAKGLTTIGNTQYYFDNNGWMKTGWQHVTGNSDWYYFASSGAMKTGWLKSGKSWYYLNADGKMATGWKDISGVRYYLKPGSGVMATGWVKDGSNWYYMKSSGAMAKGWQKVGGKWYYLNDAGVMVSDTFLGLGNKYYHFNASGAMSTGWKKIDGAWYYFASSGVAKQNQWLKSGGKWYYFGSDYRMVTGFYEVGDKTYYFNTSGAMATGWKKVGSNWRYFAGSGAMQTNKWISGKFWVDEDGIMATNSWVDGNRYYVGSDGAWIRNYGQTSSSGSTSGSSASSSGSAVTATSTVYWTPSGKKYHVLRSCIGSSSNIQSGTIAQAGTREPCAKCAS